MEHNEETSEESLVFERLKAGDSRVWKEVYLSFRPKFLSWARQRYSLRDEDYEDIIQEAFAVLHGNISQGKLSTLNSSLETYFFAVGKNKIRDMYKKKMRHWEDIETSPLNKELDMSVLDKLNRDYQNENLERHMKALGEGCQKVLRLFYFNNFSMEAIASEMSFANEQVAKNKKLKCLKQLRKLMGLSKA